MTKNYLLQVATADGKVSATNVVTAGTGQGAPLVVQTAAGQRYQLTDQQTGKGPAKLVAVRKGNDLRVGFDTADKDAGDLVLKDYFSNCAPADGKGCMLVSDQAAYVAGPTSNPELSGVMGFDGAYSELLLAQAPSGTAVPGGTAAPAAPAADASSGGLSTGAWVGIGLGALALAAGGGGGGGGGGSPAPAPAPSPAPAPAPVNVSAPTTALTATAGTGKVLLTDGTTSDANPILSLAAGQGTAGAVANIYVDGVKVGTATVAADGSLSFTPTTALADGAHSITYTYQNGSTETTASPARSITVDATPPAVTAVIANYVDDAGNITGSRSDASSTDDRSPQLQGTLSAALGTGDKLAVLRDSVFVGYATVSGTSFTYDESNLAATGTSTYRVVAEDALGNRGTPSAVFSLVQVASNADNSGDAGPDRLTGGSGNDTLLGLGGDDTLIGGVGDDWLNGGVGADALDGGTGSDTADYGDASAGVVVNLASPASNTAAAAGDSYTSIENVVGSGFADTITGDGNANVLVGRDGDDTILGGGGEDKLFGSAGNDSLSGGSGDDNLYGGLGADALDGGAGFNYARYDEAPAAVLVDLSTPASNTGEAAGDTYTNIQGVIGSTFNDTLVGDGLDNILSGAAGDDSLSGGNGNDALYGGLGADVLDGGAGTDAAQYDAATSGVTVNLGAPGSNAGEAAGDTYVSIENVVGSALADNITGDGGINSLYGNAGDDTLTGGSGNDDLFGGAGADAMDGGIGFDLVKYQDATAGVTASLANPAINTGDAAGDTYLSIEGLVGSSFNDALTGDGGDNRLEGGTGNDTMVGGAGIDFLLGQAGNDLLTGGADADVFAFSATGNEGNDTVTDLDLTPGQDVIRLYNLVDGNSNGADVADLNGRVTVGTANSGNDGTLTIDDGAGNLSVATFTGAGATFTGQTLTDLVNNGTIQLSLGAI